MRLFSTLAIVALAATPVVATAQTAPAAPAAPAAAAAPAPAYSSGKSTIGQLLENADAKAVVFKYVPELAQAGDQLSQAGGFSLKDLQQYIPTITDKTLADMDAELAKIPAKK